MSLPTHTVIILLSGIVILSYLFNMVSRKTKIPAVLLLIGTGIAIKYLSAYYGYVEQDVNKLVKILGAIGLIMIVLEAALDLDVNRKKLKLIRDSFLSAGVIFAVSATAIAWLISYWLGESVRMAAVYAVPMSIISSAIVIPSTSHLPEHKKEFIIYESSFSDIIGIMVFNYLVMNSVLNLQSIGVFAASVGLAILISVLASFMLLYILAKISIDLKFFLLFAMLALVYSAGELIHIPALLIVLVFGLVLNNSHLFLRGRFRSLATHEHMEGILSLMKSITAETSFLIRTFFFILFGYSIQLSLVAERQVIVLGTLIVLILLGARFLYLRFILRSNLFPELFLMPRGLVTILLFYSIPAAQVTGSFSVGVLFYVVVVTSLFMMAGLLFFKPKEEQQEIAEVSGEAN
ncbi:MAG: cation:proton antiporter [Bacteroidetes bacterium]|nr:cation:proton antiporter [Bacteroidota bacterium]